MKAKLISYLTLTLLSQSLIADDSLFTVGNKLVRTDVSESSTTCHEVADDKKSLPKSGDRLIVKSVARFRSDIYGTSASTVAFSRPYSSWGPFQETERTLLSVLKLYANAEFAARDHWGRCTRICTYTGTRYPGGCSVKCQNSARELFLNAFNPTVATLAERDIETGKETGRTFHVTCYDGGKFRTPKQAHDYFSVEPSPEK